MTKTRQTHEPVLPPTRHTSGTRILTITVAILATWMLIGATGRLVIQLHSNLPLDPLPFISYGLACLAIATLAALGIRR